MTRINGVHRGIDEGAVGYRKAAVRKLQLNIDEVNILVSDAYHGRVTQRCLWGIVELFHLVGLSVSTLQAHGTSGDGSPTVLASERQRFTQSAGKCRARDIDFRFFGDRRTIDVNDVIVGRLLRQVV